ncbi:Uncharacterized protein PECH_006862 [Penicillium ucsense]|uniref:Uncharacterized protein n=1 Tax=Penicillium ucsense TaxID=2839758 RepID=A0A8J8WK06_9EURO|nr:Uncharacterized protein PECM_006270 [Penicillium ucsense]KAF7735269.1 Uncharacterized protein PECH_006862 [Penicillium ucsense]
MIVEVVGSTVFLIRREHSPPETIPDIRGYGHTFPKSYTLWDASVKGSESHQRLVNYNFAGMKCVVRFEVDGFPPDLVPEDFKVQKNHASETADVDANDLVSSIQGLMISSVSVGSASEDATVNALKVSKKGHHIPQRAVFDLKTRSIVRVHVRTLEEELPRLWIRQIPNFVLAYHTHGRFNDIRVQDVREELKHWEASQQPDLIKFATLLHNVVSFARGLNDCKFEIQYEEGEKILNFREPGGIVNSVLPTSLARIWNSEDALEVKS